MSDQDSVQNSRIRDIEKRLSQIEVQFASLMTQIQTLEKIGKGIIILAGTSLGVDLFPMLET